MCETFGLPVFSSILRSSTMVNKGGRLLPQNMIPEVESFSTENMNILKFLLHMATFSWSTWIAYTTTTFSLISSSTLDIITLSVLGYLLSKEKGLLPLVSLYPGHLDTIFLDNSFHQCSWKICRHILINLSPQVLIPRAWSK